jgi:hypothetical protein
MLAHGEEIPQGHLLIYAACTATAGLSDCRRSSSPNPLLLGVFQNEKVRSIFALAWNSFDPIVGVVDRVTIQTWIIRKLSEQLPRAAAGW